MQEKIKALLEAKFPEARKDILALEATLISIQSETEEQAVQICDKLTPEVITQLQKTYRSEVDSEVSKGKKSFEENFLRKQQAISQQTSKPETPKQTTTETQGNSDEVATLLKQLQSEIAGLKAQRQTDNFKARFEAELKDVNSGVKGLLLDNFNARTFESEDEFSTYLTETKQKAADIQSAIAQERLAAAQGAPMLSRGKDGVSDSVKEFIEARKTSSQVKESNVLKTK